MNFRPLLLAAVMAVSLSACSLPTAQTPALSQQMRPSDSFLQTLTVGAGYWPESQWWRHYQDEQLRQLLDDTLQQHPDIAAAQARVALAQANTGLVEAAEGFHAQANASVMRQRLSANSFLPPPIGGSSFTLSQLSLGLQYDVDVFGKHRAEQQAAYAEIEAARLQARDVERLLAGTVVDAYWTLQIRFAENELLDKWQRSLEQTALRLRLRHGQGLDDGSAMLQLDHAKTVLALQQQQLQNAVRILQIQIGFLTGLGVDRGLQLRASNLPEILPAVAPAQLSLNLLAHRADIQASQQRVAASVARSTAAQRDYFPDLKLSALLGLESISLPKLLSWDSRSLLAGPALNLPLFDHGQRDANAARENANTELLRTEYENSVLRATNELLLAVNDSVDAQQEWPLRKRATESSQVLWQRELKRQQAGLSDARTSDQLQREFLADSLQQLQAQGHVQTAWVHLQTALGGGVLDSAPVAENTAVQKPFTSGVH